MTKSASVERKPHTYVSRLSTSMCGNLAMLTSMRSAECLNGSEEQLADLDDGGAEVQKLSMSSSSTLR